MPQSIYFIASGDLRLDANRYVVTNLAGDYIILPASMLPTLIQHQLTKENPWYDELEARHFLSDGKLETHLELLAAQYPVLVTAYTLIALETALAK